MCNTESSEYVLRKLRLWGDLLNAYEFLKEGCKEDGTRLFSVVSSTRTRGNRHRRQHRRLCLNIRKPFFTVRVTGHWHRLPGEVVDSPPRQVLKSCLDVILGNLL